MDSKQDGAKMAEVVTVEHVGDAIKQDIHVQIACTEMVEVDKEHLVSTVES